MRCGVAAQSVARMQLGLVAGLGAGRGVRLQEVGMKGRGDGASLPPPRGEEPAAKGVAEGEQRMPCPPSLPRMLARAVRIHRVGPNITMVRLRMGRGLAAQ